MSRKSIQVRIDDEGRDKGKLFTITEWPAARIERWAVRVLSALVRAGMELPENMQQGGFGALVALLRFDGFMQSLFRVPPDEILLLADEMLTAVEIHPDPNRLNIKRPIVDNEDVGDDLEEWGSRVYLRLEVFKLHANFSPAGDRSKASTSPTSPAPLA